jgi:hypothetical protein
MANTRKAAAPTPATAAASNGAGSVFQPFDLDAILANATVAERVVPVYMDRAGVGEIEQLNKALEARQTQVSGRMSSDPECQRIAQEIDAVQERIRASLINVRLQEMPGPEWRKLKRQHPPLPQDKVQNVLGMNTATFFEPAVKACMVEPVMSDEQYQLFLDKIRDGQWTALANAVLELNQENATVPLSRAASLILQSTAAASKPQHAGAQAPVA